MRKIGAAADRNGLQAFLIGGLVRDIFLARDLDLWDIDIVIDSDSASFARALARQFDAKVVIYKAFYTASLFVTRGRRIDLSTFRAETYARPGALPQVRKGDFLQDVQRRDFTINALAIALNKKCFGALIDPGQGYADLKQKRIRVFHDKSFCDDPTRILRAVRFEQRLNFRIERHTLQLLKAALKKRKETRVKAPRYFAEFKKILMEEDPLKPLRRLSHLGGLTFIHDPLQLDIRFIRKVYNHRALTGRWKGLVQPEQRWLFYFLAILKGMPERQVRAIVSRFQLSNEEKKAVLQSAGFSATVAYLNNIQLRPHQVYARLEQLTPVTVLFVRMATRRAVVIRHLERYLDQYRHVKLKVDGNDLKQMGIAAGPKIGVILKELLYEKIDHGLKRRSEEMKAVRKIMEGGKGL